MDAPNTNNDRPMRDLIFTRLRRLHPLSKRFLTMYFQQVCIFTTIKYCYVGIVLSPNFRFVILFVTPLYIFLMLASFHILMNERKGGRKILSSQFTFSLNSGGTFPIL